MNPKKILLRKIKEKGGWVNAHTHLDRAYTLNKDNFKYSYLPLKKKWYLVDEIKRLASEDDIYIRMEKALEHFLKQGIQAVCTFIDVDEIIEDRALKAAKKLKDNYENSVKIRFANQVLKGVIDKKSKYWFDKSIDFVDVIGGLPLRDYGKEEKHIDILLDTAKKNGKIVHVHVDQLNSMKEKETEKLAKKTIEHGMQGKVVAIHSISLSAHNKNYRYNVYKLMKKANIMVVSCPIAWIDHVRNEYLTPNHNSVTPIDEMIPEGISVAIGTDNICDIYKPFSDGNLWIELRVLLESCHYYNIDQLVKVATTNGLKALGMNEKNK
ncbi:amidohydrolase family protein [Blattabacterium cuenoti]|uniref:amidohydrolase family protein n=1 Tax=Blattabacterium cuenoti TaxID=1653831 RepID=UPI00163C2087|nr:amidohydrolase family protein [Blattabacterium cuenoti]